MAKWDKQWKCFTFKGKKLTGAHPFLKEAFYPDFVPPKTKFKKREGVKSDVANRKENPTDRGKLVDAELRNWTRAVKRRDWNPALAMPKMHPWSKKVVHACHKEGLTPIGAQGIVYHERTRVATAYDLLLQNAKGGLVLVELKTGAAEGFDAKCGVLSAPLESLASCRLNHAHLQLMLTQLLFEATHACKVAETMVMQVDGYGVNLHKGPTGEMAKKLRLAIIEKLKTRIR